MSMTISMSAPDLSYQVPSFEALRRLITRVRTDDCVESISRESSSPGTDPIIQSVTGCVSLLNELIPSLSCALKSLDLDHDLCDLEELDHTTEDDDSDSRSEELVDQREKLSRRIRQTLAIGAGTFRTAADELESELTRLRRFSLEQDQARYPAMISELLQVAQAWNAFANAVMDWDGSVALVRIELESQYEYLDRLDSAYRAATS